MNFVPTDDNPIHVTTEAIKAIEKAAEEEDRVNDYIRVSVVGGGCSGYQYALDFDPDQRVDDTIIDLSNSLRLVIDPISAGYLRGTVIDYVVGLRETGFKFKNPNAKRTCGCGSSWS
mgnify:CR=1 FL=1